MVRASHEGESWPYHARWDGEMVPCASNPCRLHGGGDIEAESLEDAYRIQDDIRGTATMALRHVEYCPTPYEQADGLHALKDLKAMVAERHGKPLPIPPIDSSGNPTDDDPLPVIGVFGGEDGRVPIYEVSPDYARRYSKMLSDTAVLGGVLAQVPVKSEKELRHMRMFVSPDGLSGAALEADAATGDGNPPDRITAVCRNGACSWHDSGVAAVRAAINAGGRRLSCYDTFLPRIWERMGFRTVARVPFSKAEAPRTWSYSDMDRYNHGQPDTVVMIRLSPEIQARHEYDEEIPYEWDEFTRKFDNVDEAHKHAEHLHRTEDEWSDSVFRELSEEELFGE